MMRLGYLLFILIAGTSSCVNSSGSVVCKMELSELSHRALYMTVGQLADMLGHKVEKFPLLKDYDGSISGVTLYCQDQGTIKFFFRGLPEDEDSVLKKEIRTSPLDNQIIRTVEWIGEDGRKGTARAIKMY